MRQAEIEEELKFM